MVFRLLTAYSISSGRLVKLTARAFVKGKQMAWDYHHLLRICIGVTVSISQA